MNTTPIHARVAWALAGSCWLAGTGLAVEKVLADGVASWTMLLSMPVVTLAVAVLLHIGFEDLRSWSWRMLRAPIAIALAILGLAVTLPASIGSSGAATDHVVAEATKSAADIARIAGDYSKTTKLVEEAERWVAIECKTGVGPKCEGATFVLNQRKASAAELQRKLEGSKPKTEPLADEKRLAWLLNLAPGVHVTAADVAMAKPVFPPLTFELLAAFFGCMAMDLSGRNQRRVPAAAPPYGGKLREEQAAISPPADVPAVEAPSQTEAPVIIDVCSGMAQPMTVAQSDADTSAVLAALGCRQGWLTNGELADRMGVKAAEASKRATNAERAGAIVRERRGREVMISVRQPAETAQRLN